MIGKTVSHYRLLEKIGEGGMGVVYLAEDAHLGRRVAIKFLSAADEHNYRARFLREARAVSTLSHPHIAVIHDYGETDQGQPFIVMEYVEGKPLSDLLSRSEVTIMRALEIAEAVAEALGAAHARGIIHRDIKPSNVLVDEEGRVKVVDFGLVKQLHEEPPHAVNPDAATLPAMRTSSNVIVGTPLYLSPEQAVGGSVDARSDLFALGALLYESLTGKPAFSGRSVIEIGAQILHFNPPLPSSINPRATGELDRITLKALAKQPDERYQSAAEMLAELRAARGSLKDEGHYQTQRLQASQVSHSSALKSISDTLSRPRISIGFLVLALLAASAGLWAIFHWLTARAPAPFQTIQITKLSSSGKTVDAAISPDGRYIVDVVEEGGAQSVWLRQIDVPAASKQIVPPNDGQYEGLTFSPDGRYVYYVVWENNARDVLYQVALLGSTPRKLLVDLDSPVTFSPDGKRFAFIRRYTNQGESALMIANSDGGGERIVAKRKQPNFFNEVAPAWSPDGNVIACSVRSSAGGFRGTVVQVAVADGAEKQITSRGWAMIERVAWLKKGSGLIVTAADQTSSPFQIWHISYPDGAVRRITNDLNSYVSLALSEDSTKLITVQSDRLTSISVAPTGNTNGARQVTSGVSRHFGLNWTPDGRIIFSSVAGGNAGIWIMQSDGSEQRQLTADSFVNREPSASPDGKYLVFASDRAGKFNIWRTDIDGNNAKQLTNGDDEGYPTISPDGQWLVYQEFVNGIPTLWRMPSNGATAEKLTDKYSNWPVVSPDGKLIACSYLDDTSGQWKLAVFPFSGGQPIKSFDMPMPYLQHVVWQRIRWTTDGRGLAYIDKRGGISNVWSQPLDGQPPRQVTDFKSDQIFNFAWSKDGNQFAFVRGIMTSDTVLISDVR